MGLSSKKTTSKSTETVAPSAYAQPYVTSAADVLKPAYEKSMGLMDRYQPQIDQGISYFGNIANGGYEQNPYLDQILNRTRENVTNSVGSQFSAAGRYGSMMNQDVMARALADQENQLRYQDYGTQQQRADQAAMQQQQLIGNAIGMPQGIAGDYASNTGGLLGRYLTSNGTNQAKSSGGLGGLLGSAFQIGSSIFG